MRDPMDLIGTGEHLKKYSFSFSFGEFCFDSLKVNFHKKSILVRYRQYDSNMLNFLLLNPDDVVYLKLFNETGDTCVVYMFRKVKIRKHKLRLDYLSTDKMFHDVCFTYENLKLLQGEEYFSNWIKGLDIDEEEEV